MLRQLARDEYVPAGTPTDVVALLRKHLGGGSSVRVGAFATVPEVLSDWNLLWHALSNALSNASKYGDGQVAVAVLFTPLFTALFTRVPAFVHTSGGRLRPVRGAAARDNSGQRRRCGDAGTRPLGRNKRARRSAAAPPLFQPRLYVALPPWRRRG